MWLLENIAEIAIFLGAAQGFLLTGLIFQKHSELYANRFLALLMLVISLILIYMLYVDLELYEYFPYFLDLPLAFAFAAGPLIFLYSKYLTHPKLRFKRIELLHFLPAVLFALQTVPNFWTDPNILINNFRVAEEVLSPAEYLFLNWGISLHALTYISISQYFVFNYRKSLNNYFTNVEKIKLDWLRNIIFMFMGTILIFIAEIIFVQLGLNLSENFILTSLFTGIFVYTLGYMGLLKSEVLTESHYEDILPENYEELNSEKKYQKSGLTPEKAEEYLQKLSSVVEKEELFRNSELTLNDLANHIDISTHNLSEVINTKLEQNFFEFINGFRIEAVKKELIDPQKAHYKILSLAFDAGFNSKTSFNTIFKKYTHMTPSEYRKKYA